MLSKLARVGITAVGVVAIVVVVGVAAIAVAFARDPEAFVEADPFG